MAISLAVAPSNVFAAGRATPQINYVLDLRDPASHKVGVTMTIPEEEANTAIQFPAWNALYQFRDFVRNVEDVAAECDGRPAVTFRVDLNTWRGPSELCRDLVVKYRVFINDGGIFSSALDSEHCYMNLAMLLFYLPQERARPMHIRFELPDGWLIRTLLEDGPEGDEFNAANYDELVDSPVEAAAAPKSAREGLFHEFKYSQNGATFRVEVFGDPADYVPERLLDSLKKITLAEAGMMKGIPFSRYTFILHFPRGPGGGGMEHRNGTAISVSADSLKTNYGGFESVAAHEFFHAWNVKRIRPQNLEPVDYVHGNDTRDLWFSEGVTSTYGELTLLRAGLISKDDFYAHLGEEIHFLQRRPARLWQSLEVSGREAWLEKYPDYHRPDRSISYYNKGELIGYLLDLAICHASHGEHNFDDVMRTLNDEFAKRGRFFTQSDLRAIILELVPEFNGLDKFFEDYLLGTRELDYETYLNYAGLRLVTTPVTQPEAGFRLSRRSDGTLEVQSVDPGSPAERAGLRRGDLVAQVDGRAITYSQDAMTRIKSGQSVKLQVKRDGLTLTIEFVVGSHVESEYRVEENPDATQEQLLVRKEWLEGIAASARTD